MAKVFKGKTYKGKTTKRGGTKLSGSKATKAIIYATNSEKRRNRQISDFARTIRKRFEDEAKRYERRADKMDGFTAEAKYLYQAAFAARAKAEKYYLKNLRAEFGKGARADDKIMQFLKTTGEAESREGMFSTLKSNAKREELLAKRILSTRAGSRFYAGTVQIWRGKTGEARNQAIKDFFGMDSLWQVMQHLSSTLGIDFFDTKMQELVVHRTSVQAMEIQNFILQKMAVKG